MTTVGKSLWLSLLERYATTAIQLISMVVIARLLTPEEIGLFSVAVAVLGIAQVFRDFGVGGYLIQETELTTDRIRTAFTLTFSISIGLFFVTQALADPAARFYEDQRIATALFWLSFNFLVVPLGSVTLALLNRDLQFDTLLKIRLSARTGAAFTGIALAWQGYGYLSLIYGALAGNVLIVVGVALVRHGQVFHGLSLKEWRRVFAFGSRSTVAAIVTEFAMKLDDIVIGKVLGFHSVAILSRAQGTMNLFHRDILGAVHNVAYPGFAKAFREGGDIEDAHVRSVNAMSAIGWPFYGFLALFPFEIVRLLFGDQWDFAAAIVPIYCAAGFAGILWKLNLPVVQAMGRIDVVMKAELMSQSLRIAILLACAMWFDELAPYAFGFLLAYCAFLFIFYRAKAKVLANNWPARLKGIHINTKLTAYTLIGPALLKLAAWYGLVEIGQYTLFVIAILLAAVSWVLAIRLMRHPLPAEEIFPARLRPLFVARNP